MRYWEKLGKSFSGFWRSPSLLGVLLLCYVLYALLAVLSILAQNALLQLLAPGATDPAQLFTPTIMAALFVFTVIETFVMVYAFSFFLAGFFGMVKNSQQDGSTRFREFFPSAKRYWRATFRYLWLPVIILFVFSLPFRYLGTIAQQYSTISAVPSLQFSLLLLSALAVSLIALVMTLFFFSFGPAIIVYDDAEAWSATKESFKLSYKNVGRTLSAVFTTLLFLGVVVILSAAVLFSAESAFTSQSGVTLFLLLKVLFDVLIIIAGIVSAFFVFYTYRDLTIATAARKQRTAVKETTKPIKRKR